MAETTFKGALNAVTFPMVSILQTRTVLDPQADVNVRTPRNPSGTENYTDQSIPQCIYMENVVPTGEGMQSVTYEKVLNGLAGANYFDQAITLRDENENNFLFSPAAGRNMIYRVDNGVWASINPIGTDITAAVSRAYVNGRTFICYDGLGIYEYSTLTGTFLPQAVTLPEGLTIADIRGIGSSSNYLLAYTTIQTLWSSLVNPLDFVPSLTTGAGNAIPQDVKGRITAILGISGGFIIYTTKNAVAAVYTNNSRAPFTFKEVSNAGGINGYEQVTSEQNAGLQYAWTTGGLQRINIQGAEPVSGEVNDFIAGRMWEYYDRASHTLIQQYMEDPEFPIKLAFISSRWLIISYSTTGNPKLFNYALVFDIIYKRWGKLKIDHADCFYYPYPNSATNITYEGLAPILYSDLSNTSYSALVSTNTTSPPSKLSVGFLKPDGEVQLMEMDYNKDSEHDAVVIFGKFQLRRSKLMTIQELELEGVYQDSAHNNPVQVWAAASFDGYRADNIQPMKQLQKGDKFARYAKRLTGVNIGIIVEGTFALSSYILKVTQDGDR